MLAALLHETERGTHSHVWHNAGLYCAAEQQASIRQFTLEGLPAGSLRAQQKGGYMAGPNAQADTEAPGTCLFGIAQVLEKERPHFIREGHILIFLELHLQQCPFLFALWFCNGQVSGPSAQNPG